MIHKLPEGKGKQNTLSKVNGLLKDGLKLRDVAVVAAERKKAKKEGAPGVIIAKCASKEDKEKIMKSKAKLKSSRNFADVFISNDLTWEQRQQDNNLRAIAKAVGNNKLVVRGGKIFAPINKENAAKKNNL